MNSTIVPSSSDASPPPRVSGEAPALSVVVVTWNVRDLLLDCLASLEADGVPSWAETFVVDNASSDGTGAMVAARFPWARLIASPINLGYSRGNNLAVPECAGRAILFLNPDTMVHPGTLRRMVDYLVAMPRCGAVGPRQLGADGRVQYEAAVELPGLWNTLCDLTLLSDVFPRSRVFCGRKMGWWDHLDDRDVPAVSGAALMVRREALAAVGLLDEQLFMAEDIDLCLRLREAGWTVHYLGSAPILHYGGESMKRAGLGGRSFQIAYQSFWLFLRKHGRPWAAAGLTAMAFGWSVAALALTSIAAPVLRGEGGRARLVRRGRSIAIHLLRWSVANKRRFHHPLAAAPAEGR